MGGFFGAAAHHDVVLDVFFGVDYHSHLGTKCAGMIFHDAEEGCFQREIHSIENTPFRTRFEDDLQGFHGCSGIGCISATDPQPLLVRSHLGTFGITTVGAINNAEELVEKNFASGGRQFMAMSSGKVNTTELVAALINQKDDFVSGIKHAQESIDGSLTLLIITQDGQIIAARDKVGRLPVLIGKIGLPGTNTGQREAEPPTYLVGSLPFENPIKTAIPVYQWINAVDHGKEMTATNAGIVGADKLNNDIKFLWNYAGNCITNQHGDINYTHDVLADESKLEFILVWDTVMTDSAKYADILLPDAMRSEQLNMQTQGYSEYYTAVVVGGPAQEAPGECRSSYDVCADIADKFGKKDAFTEGKTQEDWIKELYEAGAKADGNMPTWDEIKEQGVYKRPLEPAIGLVDFRTDPVKNPLSTPSGKIEIYSEQLAEIAATWELEEGDVINPIPVFTPGFQGYGSVTDEYPLYCTGFHHKSRTHSSFGFIPELEQVARQQLWINPADAESRGIASGDTVAVKSPAGEIRIEALVTPRIIPGTIGIPQGAWHKADMNGDRVDEGACVNTLTTYRPTPLAKGNGPAHSIIAQITKA